MVSLATGRQQQQQPTDRPPPLNRTETHLSEISGSQVPNDNQTSSTTATAQSRGKKFTAAECCMLAQAYLNRSTNAAVGTNQTGKTFWEGVHHSYCLLVTQANRTNPNKQFPLEKEPQLQSAWKRINRHCNKVTAISRQNPRGSGDRDDELYYTRMRVLFVVKIRTIASATRILPRTDISVNSRSGGRRF